MIISTLIRTNPLVGYGIGTKVSRRDLDLLGIEWLNGLRRVVDLFFNLCFWICHTTAGAAVASPY